MAFFLSIAGSAVFRLLRAFTLPAGIDFACDRSDTRSRDDDDTFADDVVVASPFPAASFSGATEPLVVVVVVVDLSFPLSRFSPSTRLLRELPLFSFFVLAEGRLSVVAAWRRSTLSALEEEEGLIVLQVRNRTNNAHGNEKQNETRMNALSSHRRRHTVSWP
jgi:hypothetical protein